MTFSVWYEAKHGYPPFPWQTRLAGMIQNGEWPQEVSLPTGAGKTSIIDIWAWAHEADVPGIPTRLLYVIDRRLVVDSVTAHAESLSFNVVKMRGGMVPDDSWLMDPATPTVIVSTVDQVGSRLLWRGYGLSPKVAPIHAGLVGNDALIILDEAHISTPFAETLEAVGRYRSDTLGLPWRVIKMTATPTGDHGFVLDAADKKQSVLKKRLRASRKARMVKAPKDGFVTIMVSEAEQLRANGAGVIGVICNTVDDARAVMRRLKGDKVLLTGRIRPGDKDKLLDEYLPRILSGSRTAGRAPLYVVATQTIEVGADLDFDAMVTQLAPIDSLRQRFGRVDRLGELGDTDSVIVQKSATKDWVYGMNVLRDSWTWLNNVAEGTGRNRRVDWGLLAMASTITQNPPPLRELPGTKPLLSSDIRKLRQTLPKVEVDIAPWLHGTDIDNATVNIVWHGDLNPLDTTDWVEMVAAAQPVAAEMMPCPVWSARRWLDRRQGIVGDHLVTGRDIQPGDTLVVPATYGGYDKWGWAPESRAVVTDVGNVVGQRRSRLRLHPALYPEQARHIQALVHGTGDIKDVLIAVGADVPRPVMTEYPGGFVVTSGNIRVGQRSVRLADHLPGVGEVAERITPRVLPEEIRSTVISAARNHDIGKTDPRFQALLGAQDEKLAKSGHRSPAAAAQARFWSGLPQGWRHEINSVAMLPDNATDLLRYLVGTHHGHARNVLPLSGDIKMWQQAGGPSWGLMAREMVDAYGAWGLCYLETLVRLSDWIRSEDEQRV